MMTNTSATPATVQVAVTEMKEKLPTSPHRVAQLIAGFGFAYAILFLASVWLINRIPAPQASDEEITAFYGSDDRRRVVLIGMYLLPFAAVAFLWFAALLRAWVARRASTVNDLLSTVQLGSAIAFITLSLVAAGANTALVSAIQFAQGDAIPSTARLLTYLSDSLQLIFAMRMAAIFVMTTTNIARSAGIFPRWFVVGSFAVAVFLFLAASLSLWLILVFPLWVLVLSLLILFEARLLPDHGSKEATMS